MRREFGLLIFKSKHEEIKEIKSGFQGIFVRIHPINCGNCEILEILNEGRIAKPIGTLYIPDYLPEIIGFEKAAEMFKNIIIEITSENLPFALEMGVPEIAMSRELEARLFSNYLRIFNIERK